MDAQNPPDSGTGVPVVTPGHTWRSRSSISSTSIVTVFTVTVDGGSVQSVTTHEALTPEPDEWTVDQIAQRADVPVRTIREYQTMGLVPPPRKVGRVGLYGRSHLRRLQLIARLQDRGYSLAGIGDLLAAWRGGDALTDILGLEPDELVHVDEPGAPATLDQLAVLLPALVPDRLDELLATGAVEACGPDRYCIPSPSLLQLALDATDAGIAPDAVLELLRSVRLAADTTADAVLATIAAIPSRVDRQAVDRLVGRGRGLLAHGLGRLTLHRVGRLVGVTGDDTTAQITERLRTHRRKPTRRRQ
jgi:DNA-binding transcriptional MerR regulator